MSKFCPECGSMLLVCQHADDCPIGSAIRAGEQEARRVFELERENARLRSELEAALAIVKAAIELEQYLATVNTQQRQSIVFQVPDDDPDGLAVAGFCDRLSKLSKALAQRREGEGGLK